MELEELIIKGLRYIEFPYYKDSEGITVNLIIEIRKYLFNKTNDWYKEKFEEAYKYDIGLTREKGDGYYSDDGIKYTFDENMKLDSCVLCSKRQKLICKFNIKDKFLFHFHKGSYYYINEIDHFFTYCINNHLLGKDFSIKDKNDKHDKGLLLIKNKIDEYEKV